MTSRDNQNLNSRVKWTKAGIYMPGKPASKLQSFDMPDSATQGAIVLGLASNWSNGETLSVDLYNTAGTLLGRAIGSAVADRTGYAAIEIAVQSTWPAATYRFSCRGSRTKNVVSDTMLVMAPT